VADPLEEGAAQAPQLVPHDEGDVSSRHWPLQSWKPLSQRYPHLPAVQVGCAFCTTGHCVPHAVQLFGSLVVSTHWPLHNVGVGATQDGTHV
jgi:hypothetical protein